MKFVYEYRTKDNQRHSGVISAPNRDAVFASLKAQGIRPGSVKDAPGFFNKLFGKGKRWFTIGVLAMLFAAAVVAKVGADRRAARTMYEARDALHLFDSRARRQIVGDAAVIEQGLRTGWADVFDGEAERFLASYAIPGVPPAIHKISPAVLRSALASGGADSTKAQSLEERQIRAMVEGLKDELRTYLEKGGTVEKYVRRLLRRQQTEVGYYQRAKREVDELAARKVSDAEVTALWTRRNDELRRMGIRLVPYPNLEEIEQ